MPTTKRTSTALPKGEQSRQAILAAAYDLIIRQGYAGTSMRQIAEKSRVALGGIYYHFPSKDDVFRAIVEERHPFFQMIPLLRTVGGKTVEEYVRNAAHTLVGELGRHPEFLNLMLVEIVEFKASHLPAVLRKLLPQMLPIALHMRELDGRLRAIPPLILMRAFVGMFFSYYITEMLIERSLPREMREANAVDYFVDIFLHGILAEESA